MVDVDDIVNSKIDGLFSVKKNIFRDNRGAVMHMLRNDLSYFTGNIGEIYFSTIYVNVVKGWKRHLNKNQKFVVPHGEVKFVFYDDRPLSKTRGNIEEFTIGPDNYKLLIVPPDIWYSFRGIAEGASLIANCSSIPHQEGEGQTADLQKFAAIYSWDRPRSA
ncbi:MAG: hypothetical protein EOP48_11095, partial [Sphingobacteriales bacterium]